MNWLPVEPELGASGGFVDVCDGVMDEASDVLTSLDVGGGRIDDAVEVTVDDSGVGVDSAELLGSLVGVAGIGVAVTDSLADRAEEVAGGAGVGVSVEEIGVSDVTDVAIAGVSLVLGGITTTGVVEDARVRVAVEISDDVTTVVVEIVLAGVGGTCGRVDVVEVQS